jgi:hypothetical protein
MKKFIFALLYVTTVCFCTNAGSPLKNLKDPEDFQKFANSQFSTSISHGANAMQCKNANMAGIPKIHPEEYKQVNKIAVLGFTLAFATNDAIADKSSDGYGGIPAEHINQLTESALHSLYKALTEEGYQIVKLDEVMKAPSYALIESDDSEESRRYRKNSWIATPIGSKWVEPDYINSIKSGITLVHSDTVQARSFARNKPFQDVIKEVGADAGINVVVRMVIAGGELQLGWTPLKRGMVTDMIPATGLPRIIWSSSLKSLVNTGEVIRSFDRKLKLTSESWKYNLSPSIPVLAEDTYKVFRAVATDFHNDQNKK